MLAATNERASGHIYNVSDQDTFTEQAWREQAWERANPPGIKPEDFNYEEEDEILKATAHA